MLVERGLEAPAHYEFERLGYFYFAEGILHHLASLENSRSANSLNAKTAALRRNGCRHAVNRDARSVAAEARTDCVGAIRAEKVYAIFLGLSFFKAPEVTSIGRHKIGQIIQFNSRSWSGAT
jgi:hypothetical protein